VMDNGKTTGDGLAALGSEVGWGLLALAICLGLSLPCAAERLGKHGGDCAEACYSLRDGNGCKGTEADGGYEEGGVCYCIMRDGELRRLIPETPE
jgi:hypothetical protein